MSFADFFAGYVACAIWTAPEDDDGKTLDNLGLTEDDLDSEARQVMEADCLRFYAQCHELFSEGTDAQAGNDFCLTRNGHGAGFWDGDWPENGDILTEACEDFGETNVYEYEGKIYVC